MSHSPLPWSSSGQLIVSAPVPFPNPQAQPMGKVVANLCWDFDGDTGATERRIDGKELFSNLALIVNAVNHHEKLVASLEQCLKLIEDEGFNTRHDVVSREAREVLAAVRGQSS